MNRTIAIFATTLAFAGGRFVGADDKLANIQKSVLPADVRELNEFRSRLLSATTKHLDRLIEKGTIELKGKSADGIVALGLYSVYEMNGNDAYRRAAVQLTDQILADMKAMKFGVMYIKEKEKSAGESIPGGGPPALGWYAAAAAYVLHKEGGRTEDLKYLAGVIDNYPWNENGWWASTIDVTTGIPKEEISKPSAVNKSAAMAVAAAIIGERVGDIDPDRAASLKRKAAKCVFEQIIPAQEPDGFWHYGLNGNDPKDKDILGYFMVTTHAMSLMNSFTEFHTNPAFQTSIGKACSFALSDIAPMTDPNQGPASKRTTRSTPDHYECAKEPKRGYALGMILFEGGHYGEGMKIMNQWLTIFPHGDKGMDGAHALDASVQILRSLNEKLGKPTP